MEVAKLAVDDSVRGRGIGRRLVETALAWGQQRHYTRAVLTSNQRLKAALKLYDECKALGVDVLLDDRDERPGVKFKDAELIGIPYRITIGKKLADGKVEFTTRRTKSSADVSISELPALLKTQLTHLTH